MKNEIKVLIAEDEEDPAKMMERKILSELLRRDFEVNCEVVTSGEEFSDRIGETGVKGFGVNLSGVDVVLLDAGSPAEPGEFLLPFLKYIRSLEDSGQKLPIVISTSSKGKDVNDMLASIEATEHVLGRDFKIENFVKDKSGYFKDFNLVWTAVKELLEKEGLIPGEMSGETKIRA